MSTAAVCVRLLLYVYVKYLYLYWRDLEYCGCSESNTYMLAEFSDVGKEMVASASLMNMYTIMQYVCWDFTYYCVHCCYYCMCVDLLTYVCATCLLIIHNNRCDACVVCVGVWVGVFVGVEGGKSYDGKIWIHCCRRWAARWAKLVLPAVCEFAAVGTSKCNLSVDNLFSNEYFEVWSLKGSRIRSTCCGWRNYLTYGKKILLPAHRWMSVIYFEYDAVNTLFNDWIALEYDLHPGRISLRGNRDCCQRVVEK